MEALGEMRGLSLGRRGRGLTMLESRAFVLIKGQAHVPINKPDFDNGDVWIAEGSGSVVYEEGGTGKTELLKFMPC